MKKIILLLTIQLTVLCQWQPDIRLTNDIFSSYTSYNNAPCIASYGNLIHVVWRDDRNSVDQIYYKKSTNSGLTWGLDTRLTNTPYAAQYPAIAIYGFIIHITWYDQRDGNNEIYYKRSTDSGITWSIDTRITNNESSSSFPSLFAENSFVHIIWCDQRDGNYEIYYKRSTDNGLNWSSDIRLTNNISSSEFPSISVENPYVHVVWYDQRDGNNEIYYKRSTDNGLNWGSDTRLTNNISSSECPSISVGNPNVNLVWHDQRDGNYEIYYKRSTDNGVNWSSDSRLTNNPAASMHPYLVTSSLNIHLVWQDLRDNNYELYYKRSTDNGLNWNNDLRLTNGIGNSILPSAVVSGTAIHTAWHDLRDGNYEIYYKRDTSGNIVSFHNLGHGIPIQFSLSQNYPNPFNPSTNFEFSIPKSGFVNLTIYDVLGREVETLVNNELKAGIYRADWNASAYPSGVYYYRLSSASFSETKKMALVK